MRLYEKRKIFYQNKMLFKDFRQRAKVKIVRL